MKDVIHINGFDKGGGWRYLQVTLGDKLLIDAADFDKSLNASVCCDLLVQLRNADVIDFTADETAKKLWPDLAKEPEDAL